MATPTDQLKSWTVRNLTGWCTEAGLIGTGKKADLIERLVAFYVANPDRIPAAIREKYPDFLARQATPPRRQNEGHQPLLLEQISTLLDTKLAPQADALRALEERIATLEKAPVQGEEAFVIPLPTYAPSEAAAAASAYAINPRQLHKFISAPVLESVMKNTFEVKDLWKLDPVRANEIRVTDQAANNLAVDTIRSALFPDAGDDDTRVRSKYTSLTSILRPWLVYCQLRELGQPGIGLYLLSHANHLLALHDRWKNSFPAVLSYHLEVAGNRINGGDSVPKETWLETDLQVVTNTVIPMTRQPASVSVPNQPSSSRTGGPAWSRSSEGAANSTLGCRNYNDKKPCARWPCNYKHACANCGVAGHPAGDAACKAKR